MKQQSGEHDADDTEQAEESSPGLVREFFEFLLRDAIWWLLAILVLLVIVGVVIYFTADQPVPFIYPVQ